jgi:hypothetical protein
VTKRPGLTGAWEHRTGATRLLYRGPARMRHFGAPRLVPALAALAPRRAIGRGFRPGAPRR